MLEMKNDMKYNRQTMAADYPYMKIIEILEILTEPTKCGMVNK